MNRFPLASLPTPLEELPRLSAALGGPRIFVKRDDLTGLACGGNKTRKLEYLVADALAQDAEWLITVGAVQSNHCRQTAAAARKAGLKCALVLRGEAPSNTTGNLLLDHLLGAEIHWAGKRSRNEVMAEIAAQKKSAYQIPLGGSTALGALAYVDAMSELQMQDLKFDRIIFASSSGGTHAGLVVGKQVTGFAGEILGISVDEDHDTLTRTVAQIASETTLFVAQPRTILPTEIVANCDYIGAGYAIMDTPEREAIELFARTEGLLVDPVYTGRAAAGMIDLIRKGVIGGEERILFWHTGGTPALWAYERELIK